MYVTFVYDIIVIIEINSEIRENAIFSMVARVLYFSRFILSRAFIYLYLLIMPNNDGIVIFRQNW